MKKKILLSSVTIALCTNLFSQPFLISTTYIKTYTKTQLDSLLDANGIPSNLVNSQFAIKMYKLDYLCKNAFDSLVTASGLLVVPQDTCAFPICVYNHGTLSKKSEAPSNLFGAESFIGMSLASTGYVSIMPDYLGLGDGAGLHPYQHAKTEAYSNIYMLKALKEYCASNNINLSNQLFLMGYSQGGHASMATQRMIEQNYNTEFTVSACAPMSGAYDMSGIMLDVLVGNNPTSTPASFPYIVLSWNPIYHGYTNISNVFKAPYDSLMPQLFDGNHSFGSIHPLLPSIVRNMFDSTYLYNFLNNPSDPFRLGLVDNNTYTNWTPVAPMRMFYCTMDTQVPYQNAIIARDSLRAHGCTTCNTEVVNTLVDHEECAHYAVFSAKHFIDSIRVNPCIPSGIANQVKLKNDIEIYPNPASGIIYLDNSIDHQYEIAIIDITGRIVYEEKNYENKKPIKIDYLDNGVYSIMIKSKTKNRLTKRFVLAH